ncbi:hypothetical protein JB92DRAFT_3147628 [Gautieria morchelliformis]|nr:hypothetical protein JB92DRAFT_3147628 [Gautieria morchelliformis]
MHSGESLSGAHHTHHMPPPPQPQLSHPMSGQDNDNESIAFSGYRPVSKQLERGNEIHNDDANPPSSDDEIMSSPLKKKRKIHGGIGSLARGNTAPTSRRVVVRVMVIIHPKPIGPLVLMYLPQNVHTKFLPPTRARWVSKSWHRYRLPNLLPNCSARSRLLFSSTHYFQGFTSSFSSLRFTTLKAVVLPSSQSMITSTLTCL